MASSPLRRDLGLLDAVGIGLGAIVGAGIFVVSGIAAGVAGPAMLVGLALAGAAATCNALSSAELAAAYPEAGGTYAYGCHLLGPRVGFAAGWLFLASKLAAAGAVAIGLGAYLEGLLPGIPPRALAVGAVVGFTALAASGVQRTSRVNLAVVALSVGALVALVLGGAGSVRAEAFRPFAPAGWRGTLEAAGLLFFAYTGYARIATLGEEVRDPVRTIPRAIVLTTVVALMLYAAVAVVAVGVAGADALAVSARPLAVAAEATGRPWLAPVVSVGAVAAMLGVVLSQILGLSRMAFAMARGGDLPRSLEQVEGGVPRRAVLAVGAVAAVVAATGTLAGAAASAAFAILVYYGIANAAALRLPPEAKRYPRAVAWAGLVSCAGLALSLAPGTLAAGALVLVAGFGVRAVVQRVRARPR